MALEDLPGILIHALPMLSFVIGSLLEYKMRSINNQVRLNNGLQGSWRKLLCGIYLFRKMAMNGGYPFKASRHQFGTVAQFPTNESSEQMRSEKGGIYRDEILATDRICCPFVE